MEALSEKLLKIVAKHYSISNSDAAILINKCLQEISLKTNLDLNIVYNIIYTENYLYKCLSGKCESLDLEECQKSCHCVIFDNKCISRYIADSAIINKDPYKYAKGLKSDELEQMVKRAAYLYYNYDGGGITDNSFDAMEYELNKRLKLKGRRYEKIGADPIEKLRVELPILVSSLAKIKPDSRKTETFLADTPAGGMVWSVKLDGVSGIISYIDGKIDTIYTQGNGIIGGDVTYLRDYIKFPEKISKDMIIRGEFILSKRKWAEKYTELYSNARSFISAQINQGFISPNLVDIDFVAYDILQIYGEDELPDDLTIFRTLELEGFNVAEHGHWKSPPLTFDVVSTYLDNRDKSQYNIDGLVISHNITSKPAKYLELPQKKFAFKMLLIEQIRDTTIINVEWNISRYGRYKPVAIYEAVFIDGIRLSRATAHNANKVRDWNMGVGTKVKVARSGDVIPQIKDVEVDNTVEAIFPNEEFEWDWLGPDIVLKDIDNNKYVQIKRIFHFFSTLGVPRLGEKTAEKLWENGFKYPEDITKAEISDLIKIKGFGKKSSETLYNNIHNTMQKTPMDRYITASTTLNIGIGRKMIKSILKEFPDILDTDMSESEILKLLKSVKIPGIGPKRIDNVAKNIPKFREFVMKLNPTDINEAIIRQKKLRSIIKSKGGNPMINKGIFVFTNFMGRTDYELEDYIYDNSGEISATITSSTTAIISGGMGGGITSKMRKAAELNIPIYSLNEFLDKFTIVYDKASDLESGSCDE